MSFVSVVIDTFIFNFVSVMIDTNFADFQMRLGIALKTFSDSAKVS